MRNHVTGVDPRFTPRRGVIMALWLLVVLSLWFRVAGLAHLPGFSGDEAWPMVHAHSMATGGKFLFKTPSGRWLTPTYSLLGAAALQWGTPTVMLARVPALLSGLALVLAAFLLCRRMFGGRVGLAAFTLITTSPILIAYSRIGWEPSQVPLASLIALYFSWKGSLWGVGVSLLISVWIHPTCVFLAPALLLPFYAGTVERSRLSEKRKRLLLRLDSILLLGLALAFLVAGKRVDLEGTLGQGNWLTTVWRYVICLTELFSGVTAYEDFVGPVPAWTRRALGLATGCAFLFAVPGLFAAARQPSWFHWFLRGLAFSLAAFFVCGGPTAVESGHERYALFLVIPVLVMVSHGWAANFTTARKRGDPLLWLLMGTCSLLLGGYAEYYLRAGARDGSKAHPAYRSGVEEPKAAAFAAILAAAEGAQNRPIRIVAEDWWTYWPMTYFSLKYPDVKVELMDSGNKRLIEAIEKGGFFIGFPGGALERSLLSLTTVSGVISRDFQSVRGEVILRFWRCAGAGPRNFR